MARQRRATLVRLSNDTAEPVDPRIGSAGEPFWRGDHARDLDDDHAGLGLALVDAAATALGGGLTCRAAGSRRFVAEVRLGRTASAVRRVAGPTDRSGG